jgi:hypothetical protein
MTARQRVLSGRGFHASSSFVIERKSNQVSERFGPQITVTPPALLDPFDERETSPANKELKFMTTIKSSKRGDLIQFFHLTHAIIARRTVYRFFPPLGSLAFLALQAFSLNIQFFSLSLVQRLIQF